VARPIHALGLRPALLIPGQDRHLVGLELHAAGSVKFARRRRSVAYVGFWPVSCLAMIRRWICPVPSKMS
jgi:hypothetical protein